jgi:hypothetical protein
MQVLVYQNERDELVLVQPTMEFLNLHSMDDLVRRHVPRGAMFRVLEDDELPPAVFAPAWCFGRKSRLTVDLERARKIAHDLRRQHRDESFRPWDDIVARQIPGRTGEAEFAREQIRTRDAQSQREIDAATSPEQILALLPAKYNR